MINQSIDIYEISMVVALAVLLCALVYAISDDKEFL